MIYLMTRFLGLLFQGKPDSNKIHIDFLHKLFFIVQAHLFITYLLSTNYVPCTVKSILLEIFIEYVFTFWRVEFFTTLFSYMCMGNNGLTRKKSRKWQPIPVFLPGGFHGQRRLAGYSPWDRKESDTTEQLTLSYLLTISRDRIKYKNS